MRTFRANKTSLRRIPLVKYSHIGVNQVETSSTGSISKTDSSILSLGISMTMIGRSLSKFPDAANFDKASA
jgi:hypothetical protein